MDTLKDTSVSRRCKRGMELVSEGKVTRHGDLWIVHGRGGNYTVCLDHDTIGETCSCPDWKNHFERYGVGRTCKHLVAVTIANARS